MPIPPRYALLAEMRLEQAQAAAVKAMLADTADQVRADLMKLGKNGSAITRLQLQAQQAAIKGYLAEDFSNIERSLARGQTAAGYLASQVVSKYENELLKMALDEDAMKLIANSEARRAASGVNAAMQRMGGSSYVPLSKQVYNTQKLASGWVDATINRGLAGGWSADRLAKEIAGSIDPKVRGGVSYAADRLARSEINNAFHASAAERYRKSGLVSEVIWNTSSSHPENDVCDEYRDASPFAFNKVPSKPHPFCYCFITPKLDSEEEFMRKLMAGEYGDEPFVKQVSREKVSASYQIPAAKLEKMTARQLADLQNEHTKRYGDFVNSWKGTREAMYENAVYKSLNAYRIELRDIGNKVTTAERIVKAAATKERAAAKKAAEAAKTATLKGNDRIKALPKIPTKPTTMKESYAMGKANPNNPSWMRTNGTYTITKGRENADYEINCTRVAATVEMRYRGYNVTAQKAGKGADKSDQTIQSNWVDKKGNARPLKRVNTEEELEKALLSQPEGSRFFVIAPWKQGSAHIWNAEIKGGKVIYHEGQVNDYVSGTPEAWAVRNRSIEWEKYRGRPASVRYMRVDDLEPTNQLIDNDWIVPAK